MPDTETLDTAAEATTPAAPEPVQSDATPAAPTLAGTPAEATPEQSVPAAYWPNDWRQNWAGTDEKLLKHLNRFASPDGIFKAWRYYERQRNDGRLKPARPDNGDEKALAEWRKEVGAPETPQGYADALPPDINISEGDRQALDRIFKTMHERGLPADDAREVVAEYYRMVAEGEEARIEADRQHRMSSEDALRREWGDEYRQNLNAIGVLMESHGSPELFTRLNEARLGDGSRLADDPDVMRFLAGLARETHPDGLVTITPTAGMSRSDAVADELRQLEQEMRDTRGRDPGGYWNNEGKQTRYRELLTARERMQARGR